MMKNIRYFLAAAALIGLLASCSEKDFTPATGNTAVEFVQIGEQSLTGEYCYIPVQQIAESNTSTLVSMEVLDCKVTHLSGDVLTLKEDTDYIVTRYEIYANPQSSEETSAFEIRFPDYANYQDITIQVRLTGENLGTLVEETVIFRGPERYEMSGTWSLDTFGTLIIEEDENDYNKFYVTVTNILYSESPGRSQTLTFPANRNINILEIDPNAVVNDGVDDMMWCLSTGPGTLSPGNPVQFTFTDDNTFSATGFFIGTTGYYGAVGGTGTGTRLE